VRSISLYSSDRKTIPGQPEEPAWLPVHHAYLAGLIYGHSWVEGFQKLPDRFPTIEECQRASDTVDREGIRFEDIFQNEIFHMTVEEFGVPVTLTSELGSFEAFTDHIMFFRGTAQLDSLEDRRNRRKDEDKIGPEARWEHILAMDKPLRIAGKQWGSVHYSTPYLYAFGQKRLAIREHIRGEDNGIHSVMVGEILELARMREGINRDVMQSLSLPSIPCACCLTYGQWGNLTEEEATDLQELLDIYHAP
jgi:hypothetical protein